MHWFCVQRYLLMWTKHSPKLSANRRGSTKIRFKLSDVHPAKNSAVDDSSPSLKGHIFHIWLLVGSCIERAYAKQENTQKFAKSNCLRPCLWLCQWTSKKFTMAHEIATVATTTIAATTNVEKMQSYSSIHVSLDTAVCQGKHFS